MLIDLNSGCNVGVWFATELKLIKIESSKSMLRVILDMLESKVKE